jgi:hypothetical protein
VDASFALYSTKSAIDTSLVLYYTKTSIDSSINSLLNSTYSTKSAIDTSLGLYSTKSVIDNSLGLYYTKTTIDASINNNYYNKTTIDASIITSLNLKANIASPTFTGTATIPTGNITTLNIFGDSSMNGNIVIGKNLTVLGNIAVQNYQNQNIINTTTTNYQLIISEDLSLNGRLVASGDSSFNGNIYTKGFITAATQSISDNSTRVATTEYARSLVDTSLNNALARYSTKSIIDTSLALYSTKAIVDTSLGLYYTKTAIDSSVNSLLTTAYSTKLAIDTSFGLYSTKSIVDASLALYSSKSIVDASLALYSSKSIVDASLALYSSKSIVDASLALKANTANPTFTGTTTIPSAVVTNAYISGDVSMNSRLYINGDVSMNNLLDLSGTLIAHNNVNVYGIINQYTSTLDQGYIVNYNNNTFNIDVSFNGNIYTKGGIGIRKYAPLGLLDISGSLYRTTIIDNGNIGIGTTTPASALQIVGTTTSTTFNATSDYRIKTNVISLQDVSISIDNLRPVKYTNIITNKEDIGFIAHEVQEYIPMLVSGEKDEETYQSINYNGMIGILTKEIQELKKENIRLHEDFSLLKNNSEHLNTSYEVLFQNMLKEVKELSALTANQQEEINRLKQLLGL